jgi:hypothetical protein
MAELQVERHAFDWFQTAALLFYAAAASTLVYLTRLVAAAFRPHSVVHSADMDTHEHHIGFLDLPDPCILAVLQHTIECACSAADACSSSCICSLDYRSFFGTARAHPKLQKAASVALRRISAYPRLLQLDNLKIYLENHAQQLRELVLSCRVHLRELPHSLQLDSLILNGVSVQLSQASSNIQAGE